MAVPASRLHPIASALGCMWRDSIVAFGDDNIVLCQTPSSSCEEKGPGVTSLNVEVL